MNPSEYQKECARTESDPVTARIRLTGGHPPVVTNGIHLCYDDKKELAIRILHAIVGMTTEVGEIADLFKKWIFYGQNLDASMMSEEIGDLLWYISLGCNSLGIDVVGVMEENIAKLKARFPEKFTEERAAEENRDRQAEQRAARGITICPYECDSEGGEM